MFPLGYGALARGFGRSRAILGISFPAPVRNMRYMRTMRYIAARARSGPPVRSKSLLQPRSQPLVRSKSPHRPRSELPVRSKLPLQPRSEPLVRSKSPPQPHLELPMRSCALLWRAHNSLRAQGVAARRLARYCARSGGSKIAGRCSASLCITCLCWTLPCMYIHGLALVYIYIYCTTL